MGCCLCYFAEAANREDHDMPLLGGWVCACRRPWLPSIRQRMVLSLFGYIVSGAMPPTEKAAVGASGAAEASFTGVAAMSSTGPRCRKSRGDARRGALSRLRRAWRTSSPGGGVVGVWLKMASNTEVSQPSPPQADAALGEAPDDDAAPCHTCKMWLRSPKQFHEHI